jgi:D-glycero-D-manno-heptose 1,7-bisphosphate phosphatase
VNSVSAVFLDRDGVINENRSDHVRSWDEFRFLPGSLEAIARLHQAGVRVFVITNQAIVNRGMITREALDDLHSRMTTEIARHGGRVESVIYCPHRPDEHCGCRKPMPGLLTRAAVEHGIDLDRSVVVGDALADLQAGAAAGCRTVLVLSGRGREQLLLAREAEQSGFSVAPDLPAAVAQLLDREPVSTEDDQPAYAFAPYLVSQASHPMTAASVAARS